MLLRFSVSNFLSLRDPQELSLAASALKDEGPDLIEYRPSENGVLPAAIIYGANASGKSNVVRALHFACAAVLRSHPEGRASEPIPRKPFALDPEANVTPSRFEIDFVIDQTRYHYGFEASDLAFEAEWLYAFPIGGRKRMLFERKKQKFSFGRQLKGRNTVISDLTRPNSLFLSAALQNDHETLTKVASFFQRVHYLGTIFVSGYLLSERIQGESLDQRILEFLNRVGTGIVDYRRLHIDRSEESRKFARELLALFQTHFASRAPNIVNRLDDDGPFYKIELGHRGAGGKTYYLDADDESAGTRRLLVLLGSAFTALDQGSLLVVDEVDASLHTQACEAIVGLFSSSKTNPKGAQLLATTHDTNLLRSHLLRRDQIWFTEKDSEGATHLYSLAEFRSKPEDNLEKGYLQGRYGAIPFSGSVQDLLDSF